MAINYMEKADEALLHVYNRFPVVLDHGEGVKLYDTEGKEYLDFAAGIAVCGLGYGNKKFGEALKAQIDKLTHTSNLFYNPVVAEAANALREVSQMDKVFFTNSGTEAIEGALKAARRYSYTKGTGRTGFIAMEHSFHGRSMGALSVTGTKSYRDPFEPLIPGVAFAKYNDLESVKALVDDNTCGIILEPIQGEGGIVPANKEFLEGVRTLCDEKDIVLIFDEIQCGMGRSGDYFAWQGYGVKPGIMTMAKAIGNGIPVGAFAVSEKMAKATLLPGDHGTTYGGNPLAAAAVLAVTEIFKEEDLLTHVKEMSEYLYEKLEKLTAEKEEILEHRGKGLMQGLLLKNPVGETVKRALANGLIVISAGQNVLRVVPPLVVTKEDIDRFVVLLDSSL
ncbi:MAG: acetylornithine/succinylornithine family transaminase [Clostridiales bacterium]|nr:acetylornithine/succinylornithine family transaminase [Clostridiales bacterium]